MQEDSTASGGVSILIGAVDPISVLGNFSFWEIEVKDRDVVVLHAVGGKTLNVIPVA